MQVGKNQEKNKLRCTLEYIPDAAQNYNFIICAHKYILHAEMQKIHTNPNEFSVIILKHDTYVSKHVFWSIQYLNT